MFTEYVCVCVLYEPCQRSWPTSRDPFLSLYYYYYYYLTIFIFALFRNVPMH